MKNISVCLSLFEYHVLWPSLFAVYKMRYKVDKKTVLFADSYSHELTDNMNPVYTALKNLGGYKLLTCFPDKVQNSKIKNRFARANAARRFLKLYAQSGTLILTESYLPAYSVTPREDTKVIQLWHGCGAFKKWGYSTLNKDFGANKKSIKEFPMHNCYSLVPVSSEEVSFAYSEAFNCDSSIVKPLGIPRTDVYFNKNFVDCSKQKLYDIYPDIKGKKIILYAPTFRGKNIVSAKCGVNIDFDHLSESLNDNSSVAFLCKLHPFAKDTLNIPKCSNDISNNKMPIYNVSDIDIDILLCSADILISDYSSLIFEYSLLERPMLFYAYDLESYTSERDFYYPYKDFVPGSIVTSQLELEKVLNELTDENASINVLEDSKVIKFKNKFMSACDGNSTERIIDYIIKN